MGMYKYIREAWKKPKTSMEELVHQRLIDWRKENSTVRIKRPTRIDRARSLGYKAKPGFFIVRQRVNSGGHRNPEKNTKGGRRPKRMSTNMALRKSYKLIAEERVSRKYKNCEVLNSYQVAKDGQHYWFEMIMVDRTHPSVLADKRRNWISLQRGRAHRGMTSSGRKMRNLDNKGKGAEKVRPSRRANKKRL